MPNPYDARHPLRMTRISQRGVLKEEELTTQEFLVCFFSSFLHEEKIHAQGKARGTPAKGLRLPALTTRK